MNFKILNVLLLFCLSSVVYGQNYSTRTARLNVQTSNKFMDLEANNYQVYSNLDTQTGKITFMGLLKSFEFKMSGINNIFNSGKVNVSQYPKITFDGKIKRFTTLDFTEPGTFEAEVTGMLYIWDEKRRTNAVGKFTVNEDGSVDVHSDFVIKIEEMNVDKMNKLLKERLPDVLAVDVDKLGVSREIMVTLDMTYEQ